MPLTETIEWRPASEPPDTCRSVLIQHDDFESESPAKGWFRNADKIWLCADVRGGCRLRQVIYWAEMPKGPTAEDK